MADVFKANFTPCDVEHVGRPGDRGIDVIFVDSGDNTWLIQVKRRGHRYPVEGYATLQSVLGTLVIHGCLRGIIVTTADYFSAPVRREVDRLRIRGYFVELVDRGKLNAMLGPLLPSQPWLQIVNQEVFTGMDPEVRRRLLTGMPDPAQGTLFAPTF